jgi:hypothetical protein
LVASSKDAVVYPTKCGGLFFFFGIVALSEAEIAVPEKVASANTPNATLQPAAQARSLAMLSQVVMQLERYVQEQRPECDPQRRRDPERGGE